MQTALIVAASLCGAIGLAVVAFTYFRTDLFALRSGWMEQIGATGRKADLPSRLFTLLPCAGLIMPFLCVCEGIDIALYWSMILMRGSDSYFEANWALRTQTGIVFLVALLLAAPFGSALIGYAGRGEMPAVREGRYVLVRRYAETAEITESEYLARTRDRSQQLGAGIVRTLLVFCSVQTLGNAGIALWRRARE